MGPATERPSGLATTLFVLALVLAGFVDVAAVATGTAASGAVAVPAYSLPSALLPFTLAAVLAPSAGRVARIGAFFGAAVGLVCRIVLAGLLALPDWSASAAGWLSVAAGLLTGVALLGWTLYQVLRHSDLANEPRQAPVAHPARHSAASVGAVTVTRVAPRPVSPATPVDVASPARQGSWATATTPWPRANEDDPNGTLIRPPRR